MMRFKKCQQHLWTRSSPSIMPRRKYHNKQGTILSSLPKRQECQQQEQQEQRLLSTSSLISSKSCILSSSLSPSASFTSRRSFSSDNDATTNTVPITYIEPDGKETTVDAEIGQNMMQVAHDNDIELEGACGGELACSTCHLIFEKELYDTLPEKEEEEDDMLDLAFEVTETSRLGCQILVREDFSGTTVQIPDDGF